jgi:hypothetical protein
VSQRTFFFSISAHTEVNGSLRNTGSVKIWKHGSNYILNIAVILVANLLEIIKFYQKPRTVPWRCVNEKLGMDAKYVCI